MGQLSIWNTDTSISSANYCRASDGGNQGKDPHSSMAGHLGSFWWDIFFARIFFLMIFLFLRWLSYPAHPGLLLQLRQHDDLTWPPTSGDNTGLWIMASYWSLLASYSQLPASDWQSFLPSFSNNLFNSIFRQHGSPDLTYADFIVVQSVWGMTQGLIMPLSGYISRWHNVIIVSS